MIASRPFGFAMVALTWLLAVPAPAAVSVLGITFSPSEVSIVYPSEDGIGVALADHSPQRVTDVISGQPYHFGAEVVLDQSHSRAEMTVTTTPSQWLVSVDLSVRKMAGHFMAQVEFISLHWSFEVTEPVPFSQSLEVLEQAPTDFILSPAGFFVFGPDGEEVEGDTGVFVPGIYDANMVFLTLSTGFNQAEPDTDLSGNYRSQLSVTIPEPRTPMLALAGLCGFGLVRRRDFAVKRT